MQSQYGTYFKRLREETEHLTLKELESRCGLSRNTIYANENGAEVSLNSAALMLYGLNRNFSDAAKDLGFSYRNPPQYDFSFKKDGQQYIIEVKDSLKSDSPSLTPKDIRKILNIFSVDPDWVLQVMDSFYRKILIETVSKKFFNEGFLESQKSRNLSKQIESNLPIVYPNIDSPKMIEDDLFKFNSALNNEDASTYLRLKRKEKEITMKELAEVSSSSYSVINRMELGHLQEIRLDDAVKLNNILTPDGTLLAIFTRSAELHTGIIKRPEKIIEKPIPISWTKEEHILSNYLIRFGRWMEVHTEGNLHWINDLRNRIDEQLAELKKGS
jgi:transcriptional regulator with XRE-family HTH domain